MPRSTVSLRQIGLVPIRHRPRDRDPFAAYLGGLRPTSQRAQTEALQVIAQVATRGSCSAETLPWEHWRAGHTEAVVRWLTRKYSAATVERHLGALRGVLREAWCLRLMDAEAYYRAARLPGRTGSPQRALGQGELRALLSACAADPGPGGRRDAALVWLLFRSGLRPGEVVDLDAANLDPRTRALALPAASPDALRRQVLLSADSRAALLAWVPHRVPAEPALLQAVAGGQVVAARLVRRHLPQLVRARMAAAGLRRPASLAAYPAPSRRGPA
ncbi:MAG TPA: hypothetical protein VNN74_04120 [Candidatus Micrarchaeia archaeon]|nr:hypothetical protein [Candidatus Micrarchaeia archaeon]